MSPFPPFSFFCVSMICFRLSLKIKGDHFIMFTILSMGTPKEANWKTKLHVYQYLYASPDARHTVFQAIKEAHRHPLEPIRIQHALMPYPLHVNFDVDDVGLLTLLAERIAQLKATPTHVSPILRSNWIIC